MQGSKWPKSSTVKCSMHFQYPPSLLPPCPLRLERHISGTRAKCAFQFLLNWASGCPGKLNTQVRAFSQLWLQIGERVKGESSQPPKPSHFGCRVTKSVTNTADWSTSFGRTLLGGSNRTVSANNPSHSFPQRELEPCS